MIFKTVFVILFSSLVALAAANNAPHFPQIETWKNLPKIEFEENKSGVLKKDQALKNAFLISTGAADQIQIRFAGGEVITILPNTKIDVPQVSPDTGEASELSITEGKIRIQSGASSNSKLRIKSLFFNLKIPAATDLFLTVDLTTAWAKIDIIQGEMMAAFLDFEKTQVLKMGESVTFKGEREGSSIKYDYLLNSRKAPHGSLQPVQPFDTAEFVLQEKANEKAAKEALQKRKAAEAVGLRKKQAFENSFLCHKPYGQRDQCYWKKKNQECYRYRCNVSGQWGDETERPLSPHCDSEIAAPCDY